MNVVVFVGCEGSGKTFMTDFFTNLYQSVCSKEYGAWYCKNILGTYLDQKKMPQTTETDYLKILSGQKKWNEIAIKNAMVLNKKICFFDTDAIFTKYFYCKQFKKIAKFNEPIARNKNYLHIFLNNEKLVFKKDAIINLINYKTEIKILKNLYKKHLLIDNLIFIKSKNWKDQKKEIYQIFLKYFSDVNHPNFFLN